ncbi:MAG: aminotransferase class [Crocinitomicaceae bacterium]|jgi:selenocysteine lyase/cysteine desulfurase|nr:aminotransferase class [Crocinitomicaceae bacterium]
MQNQKHKFRIQEGISYINCAYMAPLMQSTEEAGIQGMIRKRNPFEISQEDFFTEVTQLKGLFAQVVNCRPGQVALFPSTSYGFASVLNNILSEGRKHCVLIENEFPSGYFAAEKWAQKHQARLEVVAAGDFGSRIENWNEAVLNAITPETAFVLLSYVHWFDGSIFDLKRLGEKCKSLGVKLIVDGTQGIGALPLDLQEYHVDALVCATYKWLLGPYSSAIGYISDTFSQGEPLEESWMNRQNAQDFANLANYEESYFPLAGRYNVGETSDFMKIPMLIDSIGQLLEWQSREIQAYCKKILSPLRDFMAENGIHLEAERFQAQHLVGFQMNERLNAQELIPALKANNIILSVRGNSLRVSPHLYNTEQDIEKLIGVLKENIKIIQHS